jgi:guanylate kinase
MGPAKMMNPKIQNNRTGNLIILSGPSGAGKTTLRKSLQKNLPDLHFSVSWTTRPPRAEETPGQDYRFVSLRQFERNKEADGFLEWAKVHEEYYGSPLIPIQRWMQKGEDVLLDIDIQGARKVKKKIPQAIAIFILPPSHKELEKRLNSRETESREKIRIRLKNARTELLAVQYFDYALINQEIPASIENLLAIIKASRFRVLRTHGLHS